MKWLSIIKNLFRVLFSASFCLAAAAGAVTPVTNSHTLSDPQEITAFPSGYDIASIKFTLHDSETLQIDVLPYGIPGDADGDGNPDASSTPAIIDSPGVSGNEVIFMGMVCNYIAGAPCEPNLNLTYADNVLSATTVSGVDVTAYITFQLLDAIPDPLNALDTYRLTINNLSAVKTAVLGSAAASTVSFGAFSFSAHFDDAQPDDIAPDANPSTGELNCEPVELVPPTTTAPGTGTIGYWKNHPSEWPVGCNVTLPGSENDPNVFAMNVLGAPVKGDKTVSLAKQLVAAKLNICAGNDGSCVVQTITDATAWLNTYGPVFAQQKNWNGGDVYHEILDDYNNGKLCAPHR
ncbi:MAG: hypothetical protein ACYC1T_04055 [Sulfuricaulis sp.]